MRILVSACLLGIPCRYDGKSKPCAALIALAERHILIPVCPEQLGGLPTPRPPAERQGGFVRTQRGSDVTNAYARGAESTVRIYEINRCDCAVLKSHSPSCGRGIIYDGTFSGRLTAGDGVTAQALMARGYRVFDEREIAEWRGDPNDP